VEIPDEPGRKGDERGARADEYSERERTDGEADAGGEKGEATAADRHRMVVVLAAPMEVDVAVLHVCRIHREEDRGHVNRAHRERELAGDGRTEPRGRKRRQHEHRVDLREQRPQVSL